jgi:hypothetical protein
MRVPIAALLSVLALTACAGAPAPAPSDPVGAPFVEVVLESWSPEDDRVVFSVTNHGDEEVLTSPCLWTLLGWDGERRVALERVDCARMRVAPTRIARGATSPCTFGGARAAASFPGEVAIAVEVQYPVSGGSSVWYSQRVRIRGTGSRSQDD